VAEGVREMVHSPELIRELEQRSRDLYRDVIDIFEGSLEATGGRGGHVGGTLSLIQIVTALYFHHIRFDSKNPRWEGRDRVILSKAHCCEALYAALIELGVIDRKWIPTYYQYRSPLQGHADRWCTPGIEFSGGSLGEGLSHGLGVALAATVQRPKYSHPPSLTYKLPPKYRVYCILGDGECHEGEVWEAAMAASTYKVDNLVAIVDYNKYCIDGPVDEVIRLDPFSEKWKSFGWSVIEVNGHDLAQLVDALDLTDVLYGDGKPKCILAHTVKGKGVPYWEERHAHYAREDLAKIGIAQAREALRGG